MIHQETKRSDSMNGVNLSITGRICPSSRVNGPDNGPHLRRQDHPQVADNEAPPPREGNDDDVTFIRNIRQR